MHDQCTLEGCDHVSNALMGVNKEEFPSACKEVGWGGGWVTKKQTFIQDFFPVCSL